MANEQRRPRGTKSARSHVDAIGARSGPSFREIAQALSFPDETAERQVRTLLARLKRAGMAIVREVPSGKLSVANVEFDPQSWTATVDGSRIVVRHSELVVLKLLLEHAGKVVTRERLLDAFRTTSSTSIRSVDIAVARLRQALSRLHATIQIRCVVRTGYVLEAIPEGTVTSARARTSYSSRRRKAPAR